MGQLTNLIDLSRRQPVGLAAARVVEQGTAAVLEYLQEQAPASP
jgi:hypothetical protein